MSNEDIKKGIAIQAKADAEKIEKLAKGLHAHKSVLSSLKSGQNEIRETMDVVLDDMSVAEAKNLYDLQVRKAPDELDLTEKRVLCASIYTLISSYEQNTSEQITFYNNLEKYLGISERKSDFDFNLLNNIDSHTDRLVVLKTICSFLFLKQESFSFLREKDAFSWLFSFASIQDISDVCCAINAEHAVLGTDGILSNYDPALAMNKAMDEKFYTLVDKDEGEDENEDVFSVTDDYQELKNIINDYLSDEKAFGKGVGFSEDDFKKELSGISPIVAFDSLIAASKIDKGYLIFTTYALYFRAGSLLGRDYACIPYESIVTGEMYTAEGKQDGTRKLFIPVMTGRKIEWISIDDSKLEEEKLRDLLVNIVDSGCQTAETDRIVEIVQLDRDMKSDLLSAMVYLLVSEHLPLLDLYLFSKEWGFEKEWDSIALACENDDDYEKLVEKYRQSIPYPSGRVIAFETIELILSHISRAYKVAGKNDTFLSMQTEMRIRLFSTEEIENKLFNQMVKKAAGKIKNRSYEFYKALRDELSQKKVFYEELIYPYVEKLIEEIESGFEYKAKSTLKKKAKDFTQAVNTMQEKVRNKNS